MAAPTFFGKGTLDAENSGTSITPIDFPASIAANDIAVMAVGCNNTSTFTTPSGQGAWAILGTSLESDAGQSTEWYWLRLTGSETAETVTASATFSNTVGGYGQIWVFRGCITTGNPFEGVGNDGTAAQTTPDSTAVTTTDVDRLVVCICLLDDNVDAASGFPPSGWTDMGGFSSSSVGGDWATKAMERTEASATTVPAAVVGTWGASLRWRTISFALVPPAAGAGTDAPAGNALAAGVANQPAVTIAPNAGSPTAAGSAPSATASVRALAGSASASGEAFTATLTVVVKPAGPTGAGDAPQPEAEIGAKPNTPEATGTGNQATVQTAAFTNAPAGLAAATGTADNAIASIAANSGLSAAIATAPQVAARIDGRAGQATATGTANQATVTVGISALAGLATATGFALAAKATIGVQAGFVLADGEAFTVPFSVPVPGGDLILTLTAVADPLTLTGQGHLTLVAMED